MSRKTTDGIQHADILRVAEQAGVEIRTNARTMLAPWLARATGKGRQEVYQALCEGDWYN